MTIFLAADVGGTKCELALFELGDRKYTPLVRKRYPSSDYDGIEEIVKNFLAETELQPEVAGFGVAGPVNNGVAQVTNLPWVIDEDTLKEEFTFSKVMLINDLTAVCGSISVLTEDDLLTLYPGRMQQGMKGVIAPGTGLGEGYLLDVDSFFLPQGSEGGHANFAPIDEEQTELLAWMQTRISPVSYEDLIAGSGIPNLYDFFIEGKKEQETPDIKERLLTVKDRTPVIVDAAFSSSPCPVCEKVVYLFLSILGSEAGNLALKTYARGGLYIGGGIVPRLVGKIDFDVMVKSYLAKGKMAELIESIPLYLITRKDAALIGVAHCCEKML